MGKATKQLAAKGRKAAAKAYRKVETKVLAAEGRRSVRAKLKTAGQVSKKAAKTGLIVGALAAAKVVVQEIRRRKRLD